MANVNRTGKTEALAATMRLAIRQQRFTSYDVLQELEKSDVTTHDLRCIGVIMQEAGKLGLITSVGLVRRNNKHTRGATTLWESRSDRAEFNPVFHQPFLEAVREELSSAIRLKGLHGERHLFQDIRGVDQESWLLGRT